MLANFLFSFGDHLVALRQLATKNTPKIRGCEKCGLISLVLPLPKTDPIQTIFHRKIGTFRLFICLIRHAFAQGLANVRLFAENTQFLPHVSDKQGVISTKTGYFWSILRLNSVNIIKAFCKIVIGHGV